MVPAQGKESKESLFDWILKYNYIIFLMKEKLILHPARREDEHKQLF